MKLKNLSLIATAAAALSFTVIPQRSVQAESAPKVPLQLAQANQQLQPPRIQLSQQQQQKIAQIRANARNSIEKVLTQKQRDQIKTAMQSGQPPQQAFAALDFTPQQKTQLQQILVSSQQQMEAVLTPQQKKQLDQYRENLRRQQQQQR
ncbi:hypothetical protein [Fischerella thermalis]|uniref:P pilus assembly/Cpx signaling pathway, periplasmic inhibitor/zinc-resistance associated protein n=1 Tax=Fischerella thermalis CCMEE 5318 TaxID=2019666 RepID=A0A2N6LJW4_9CYAN|nr:hypothetical protein [Fischerella thermalis]PMB19710.1 hypothetical protein CEN47_22870 [Fischerella thermalis CCMEE 5319]PMB24908.1 hypothetical protein CEN46_06800 [Fischerella thermalis CCMEE 5318]